MALQDPPWRLPSRPMSWVGISLSKGDPPPDHQTPVSRPYGQVGIYCIPILR